MVDAKNFALSYHFKTFASPCRPLCMSRVWDKGPVSHRQETA